MARLGALIVGFGLLLSGPALAQTKSRAPFYERLQAKPRDGYELRSGFGPIASFLYSKDWEEPGVGGFSHRSISVSFDGAYRFDLVSYLQQSGQDAVLRAAVRRVLEDLEGAPLPAKDLPPLEELRGRFKSYLCRPGDWGSFWVDKWDGADTAVLVVEICQPASQRSATSMSSVSICIKVPAEWKPWLPQGVSAAQLAERARVRSLSASARQLAAARLAIKQLPRAKRRTAIQHRFAEKAPLSAVALLTEFFPWLPDASVDRETQWASLERAQLLSKQGQTRESLEALAPFFGQSPIDSEIASEVARLFAGSSFAPGHGRKVLKCLTGPEPLACMTPIYFIAREALAKQAAAEPFCPADPLGGAY